MNMTINEFILKYRNVDEKDYRGTPLEEYYEDGIRRFIRNPYLICKDVFQMSVQASETHYSAPKGFADKYSEVEIGYPSMKESLIMPYCEDDNNPCDTVYGYVPVELVNRVIEKHGGINEEAIEEL